ncbi:hypothetical protein PROFUN_11512 [Planoprotostelium fungivorum]|uniref:Uncharacterized protein n=1 Tax=Planoprotostelium fungivorum TaxID=1890364 RepID=A0A2P6NA08_9EUKA|nr:hypothetical protein PROFUN_11512 [Planoprotostelium fungivorum]
MIAGEPGSIPGGCTPFCRATLLFSVQVTHHADAKQKEAIPGFEPGFQGSEPRVLTATLYGLGVSHFHTRCMDVFENKIYHHKTRKCLSIWSPIVTNGLFPVLPWSRF